MNFSFPSLGEDTARQERRRGALLVETVSRLRAALIEQEKKRGSEAPEAG
jgi:hypothetical protein